MLIKRRILPQLQVLRNMGDIMRVKSCYNSYDVSELKIVD